MKQKHNKKSNDIPAFLTNGEYVLNKSCVNNIGLKLSESIKGVILKEINKQKSPGGLLYSK